MVFSSHALSLALRVAMSLIWLGNMEVDFRPYRNGSLNKPTHGRNLLTLRPEELVILSTTDPGKVLDQRTGLGDTDTVRESVLRESFEIVYST
jgi:hypothetical protein